MAGSNEKLHVLRRIPEIRFDEELRGYNKHQVDRVLENLAPLADEVDVLVDRLSEAERRAAAAEARVMEGGGPAPTPLSEPAPAAAAPVGAENFDETLSKTLLLAQRTADATVEEANENAARIVAEAEADARATREAAEQEATSARASAAEERSASIEQANREVAAMIDAARTTIDTKVAEAEAELEQSHAATRDDLVDQIASLQRARDALALDVEHFEGHLSSRREVIRGAIAELADVVDHPERLRTVMPPTPVAELPDVEGSEPAQIGVASLDTLATAVTEDAEAQGVLSPDLSPSQDSATPKSEWADGESTWADIDASQAPTSHDVDVAAVDVSPGSGQESRIDDALSSGVLVDPIPAEMTELGDPFEQGALIEEPTLAVPVIDADVATEDGPDEGTSDPFLDELRRATSDDDDDEALSKFLNDADGDDDGKGGWFGRRK